MDEKEYQTKKKPELIQLCKDRGLAVSGNKIDLIGRLLGKSAPVKKNTASQGTKKSTEAKGGASKDSSKKPIHSTEYSTNNAIEKARESAPFAFCIKRNVYGNFEHPETHLVFHPETKQVIGRQEGETLVKLSFEDVKVCEHYNFKVDMERIDGEIVINETSAEERYKRIQEGAEEEKEDFVDEEEEEDIVA